MPVGHVRINDPNPNPNDNITFIRVLEDLPDSNVAVKILTALAAQFKPIMKEWGFGVNSLVEYEWNPTFAGRNWNAGEVVEIVLRRRDGTFAPYQFLLYVMCHELAHIREMNHSWAFQKVNSQIRSTLARLRAQGYFGDGFWSGGRSLKYPNAELPAAEADLATMTCGGANKKSRGARRRHIGAANQGEQRERGSAVKLGTTGRQTAIPRKAGGRVSKKNAFAGEGKVLSEDPAQSTFKRRAQAQKAIEARAAAAEARIAAEKRARAAEARVKAEAGSSRPGPTDKKPEPDINLADSESEPEPDTEEDEPDDLHDVGGGWETDDEDKPTITLNDEERRWLASDMHNWEATFADEGEDIKPTVGTSKGKGRSMPNDAPPATSKTKRKASPPAKSQPTIEIDDLTPEERAWLEEDMAGGDKGVEEASGAGGKKARVAYMPMPAWMGGESSGAYDKDSCDAYDKDSCDDHSDVSSRTSETSNRAQKKARRLPELAADQPFPSDRTKSAKRDTQGQNPKPQGPKNLFPPLTARAPPTLPASRKDGVSRAQSATSASSSLIDTKSVAKSSKAPSFLQKQKAASKMARKAQAKELLDEIATDEARSKLAKTKSSSLKDLAASLRTKPSVTARAMKHAKKQRSNGHAVLVGLELRAEERPARKHTERIITIDEGDNASSSASSVCSIPTKLDDSLSTEELTNILASLDKQAVFNTSLAAKRARKLATPHAQVSPRPQQDLVPGDAGVREQEPPSPGIRVNDLDTTSAVLPSTSAADPSARLPSKAPSKSLSKSPSKSPPKLEGKPQRMQAPKLDATARVYQAALEKQEEKKALIEQMAAQGQKWCCRICEFENDARRPSCKACFLGTIAGSTGWTKPAKSSQQKRLTAKGLPDVAGDWGSQSKWDRGEQ